MGQDQFKIIWALDAFEDSPEVFGNSIRLLRNLASTLAATVEPVYVLGPKQLNLSFDLTHTLSETYLPAARKSLAHRLKSAEISHLQPAHVIVNHKSSLRESASLLLKYAETRGASMIVTGTHARQGLSRLLLGSFTEELMLQSPLPLVSIGSQGPNLPKGESVKKILFPTDLQEGAFPVFQRLVDLAEKTRAKITLLHTIPKPLAPAFQSGVYLLSGAWVPYQEFPAEEQAAEARVKSQIAEWFARVKDRTVPIESVIETQAVSITASIFEHADREPSTLIALAAQSGRFASTVLGSVTRQVVRGASSPVWVCRAEPLA